MAKKGVSGIQVVIALLIGIIVLYVVVAFMQAQFKKAGKSIEEITPSTISFALQGCRLQAARGFSDADKDGYPDFCDVCEGGDDGKHSDADWVPDDCDAHEKTKGLPAKECGCEKPEMDSEGRLIKSCGRLLSIEPFKCAKK
ncbi:MAG: hypothetical protein QXU88_00945 [Candidatus Woesearchaeota archaeon]